MAAQFAGESPVASHSTRLAVTPGDYRVELRERLDADGPRYTMMISRVLASVPIVHDGVPWFDS